MTIGRAFAGALIGMIVFVVVLILTAAVAGIAAASVGDPDAFDWLFIVGLFGAVLAGVGCCVAYVTRGGARG